MCNTEMGYMLFQDRNNEMLIEVFQVQIGRDFSLHAATVLEVGLLNEEDLEKYLWKLLRLQRLSDRFY